MDYTLTKNQMRLLRYAIKNQKMPLHCGKDDLPDVEALEAMGLVVVDRETEGRIYWSLET